eukprot:768174-Hanusia_phi.AAC.7
MVSLSALCSPPAVELPTSQPTSTPTASRPQEQCSVGGEDAHCSQDGEDGRAEEGDRGKGEAGGNEEGEDSEELGETPESAGDVAASEEDGWGRGEVVRLV